MLSRVEFPVLVAATCVGGLAMLVPSILAATAGDDDTASAFVFSSIILLMVSVFCAIALANRQTELTIFRQLVGLLATFAFVPLLLALPVYLLTDEMTLVDGYIELVSCFTTTGASVVEVSAASDIIHFWRAEVGWLGGLLMWAAAIAIYRPLDFGGFESVKPGHAGSAAYFSSPRTHRARCYLSQSFVMLAPLYTGITAVLWCLLVVTGMDPFPAIIFAMSTVATSGIGPGQSSLAGATGYWGELVILLFLTLALSRFVVTGSIRNRNIYRFATDPEINVAMVLVSAILALLLLFEWQQLVRDYNFAGLRLVAFNCWGIIFNALSFLTTTGFESAFWPFAHQAGDHRLPGLALITLAVVGGGIATTAGGIKLLRVYLLFSRSQREMHRIVLPRATLSTKPTRRVLRPQGASLAWIFCVLFVLSFAVLFLFLAARGLEFESALTVSTAVLTTTGPLIEAVLADTFAFQDLDVFSRLVLAFAMIVGRLELLVFVFIAGRLEWLG